MYSYGQGEYLMAKRVLVLMLEMMIMITMLPQCDPATKDKRMMGMTPTRCMDESGQGPNRAVATAHPLGSNQVCTGTAWSSSIKTRC